MPFEKKIQNALVCETLYSTAKFIYPFVCQQIQYRTEQIFILRNEFQLHNIKPPNDHLLYITEYAILACLGQLT